MISSDMNYEDLSGCCPCCCLCIGPDLVFGVLSGRSWGFLCRAPDQVSRDQQSNIYCANGTKICVYGGKEVRYRYRSKERSCREKDNFRHAEQSDAKGNNQSRPDLGIVRFVNQSIVFHFFFILPCEEVTPQRLLPIRTTKDHHFCIRRPLLILMLYCICHRWKVPGMAGPPSCENANKNEVPTSEQIVGSHVSQKILDAMDRVVFWGQVAKATRTSIRQTDADETDVKEIPGMARC